MSDKKNVSLEQGWLIVLRDLGIRPENVLRRAKLPEDLMHQDNARCRADEYCRLWDALKDEANDPQLPIKLAEALSAEAFHPSFFAALCSPNLSIAVRRMSQYKKLVGPMILVVEEDAKGLYVGIKWEDPHLETPPTLAHAELGFLVQIARLATRERIQPYRVESPFPMAPEKAFRDFFGVVPTMSERNGVTFHPQDARRPFLTANENMWSFFEPDLQRRLSKLDASVPLPERIGSALLESLPGGEADVGSIARRLGLSTRTLQRRLKADGVVFKEIVRQTRERLAHHYLKNTTLSYGEISFLLGFGEPSSFFRAFKGWTGLTPEMARNQ